MIPANLSNRPTSERPLRILQIGTVETGGGAATVAGNLQRGYQARGCDAWMAVGRRTSDAPGVFAVPDDDRAICRMTGYAALQQRIGRMAGRVPASGWGWLGRSLRLATHPRALAARAAGAEDFEFPGTYGILDLLSAKPDIVQCHNLHGGYFDLRALAWLSRQVPTVLTLHDSWLLSGHCAHSFDCERWTTGCGECPDLSIYPAIRRDRTAANWIRKRDIYAGSRLYVTTPARWLIGRVERSMLAPACQLTRVIPNGVDLSIFRPADKRSARRAVGIEPDARVVLLVLASPESPWDDRDMLDRTVRSIATRASESPVQFLAVGAGMPAIEPANVRREGWQTDPAVIARYYQAADVYLHCARAGTFPGTIVEALACGTPVVASEVGGIAEQIRSAPADGLGRRGTAGLDGATGLLVAPGDAAAAAAAVVRLLGDAALRERLGAHAAADARARFDLSRQVECYLAWYRTIIEHWHEHVRSESEAPSTGAARAIRMALD